MAGQKTEEHHVESDTKLTDQCTGPTTEAEDPSSNCNSGEFIVFESVRFYAYGAKAVVFNKHVPLLLRSNRTAFLFLSRRSGNK